MFLHMMPFLSVVVLKYDIILVLTVFKNSRIVLKAAVETIYSFLIACSYINLSPAIPSSVSLNCLFWFRTETSGSNDVCGWLGCAREHVGI